MRAVCRVEPPIEQLMHWRYTCTAVRHRVSDYEFDPGPNAAQFGDSNGVGTGCEYQLDAVWAGIEAGVAQYLRVCTANGRLGGLLLTASRKPLE